jgi:hypothetical protein
VEGLPSADIHELRRFRLFKRKTKEGVVDRVEGSEGGALRVIGRGLFKKEADMNLFVGLKVATRAGQVGRIEAAFGKSGKFVLVFPTPGVVDAEAAALGGAAAGGGAGRAAPTGGGGGGGGGAPPIRAGDALFLR